ncbi:G-protein coupled receptor 183-like [Myxocyprinus asiaticus]|uniref:G-protein coupled receptor 183-like n=1 Tax=Myxocyprinus asiaticus TaxID=70543 RepID=UPI002223C704|nr:G-protein coupled receptor 183-like [Myxocyprinus asiaticus]
MNYSTVNSTTPEASTISTTDSIDLMESLEICLYSINFLFGLPAHSYVIWLIVTGTQSGIASGFFNLNLSVCEIGNCLNSFIFALSMWFSCLTTLECFLLGLSLTGRPLFQCLKCVERFLAVVHPVTFLKFKPLRYRAICSTAAWIICFGSCFVCMFTIDSQNIKHFWFLSMQCLIFLSIQLVCLSAVLRALKQSGPGESGRERGEENHVKRRAFYLILITTVTMVIQYVPSTISGFFTILKLNISPLEYIALICYLLSGFVHPVLYLHRAGKLPCHCSPNKC